MKKLILGLAAMGLAASFGVASATSYTCYSQPASGVVLMSKSEIQTQVQNAMNAGNYTSSNPIALEDCVYVIVAKNSQGQKVKLYFDPISGLQLGTSQAPSN